MIGAIIGDYFGGTLYSPGQLILEKVGIFQLDYAWAVVPDRDRFLRGNCADRANYDGLASVYTTDGMETGKGGVL
jgi:hypothetical protein